ncbi:MAG: hypothetical protein ACRD26_16320, partial [Vicinamibacterales bacterium]
MARIIADVLGGDLDVVLVRKLRAPEQPELAIGAVDEAGAVLKGRLRARGADRHPSVPGPAPGRFAHLSVILSRSAIRRIAESGS